MKESRKKETMILAASAFILLSALTTTGLYIQTKNLSSDENGYIVDLSSVEDTSEKTHADADLSDFSVENHLSAEAELDYDPDYLFPNQSSVGAEIYNTGEVLSDPTASSAPSMTAPSVSGSPTTQFPEAAPAQAQIEEAPDAQETLAQVVEAPLLEDTEAISMTRQPALAFQDSDMLQWPVVGDVLINYSMDKTIYYPTLDQYKYNPGIVISAAQGTTITAPATGRVVSVSKDPQYGNTVVMDLGDGYELTCGQLDQITVSEGSFVSVGEPIACIAAPTKYFSVEGSNLFMKLEKDGTPISPLSKLQ